MEESSGSKGIAKGRSPIIEEIRSRNEARMILALSLFNLLLGTGLAYAAPRMPSYSLRLEQSGGTLFIAGLVLIGLLVPRGC